jgi:hypothetical protein
MPLWKCTKCHHEWEGDRDECDWCNSDGKIIDTNTPLGDFVKSISKDIPKKN